MFNKSIKVNNHNHLCIGGADTVELAKKFGTPLYVVDEDYIRHVCRNYLKILKSSYPDSLVCFASKAFSCKAIYKIVESEGLGTDVVSAGELQTALSAGFDANKIYFHGNNKLPHEIELAIKSNVHAIVLDSLYEVGLVAKIAKEANKTINVLIRINPGIEAHTHEFIQTSRVDSKFGVSINGREALALVREICKTPELKFLGLHNHIGSQIFELKPFKLSVNKLTDFIVEINKELGVSVCELNIGGGFGIHYLNTDKPLEPFVYVRQIVDELLSNIRTKGIAAPRLIIEPGRSIVGEAGLTLYTVGAIKEIPGIKKYVNIDGGMFENPRYALYKAQYTAVLASNVESECTEKVTVAGKCCESSDILVVDAELPAAKPGDILAVLSTGAYNYSMASNYNRNLVPPVVLVKDGKADYIVRPQTYEELLARDIVPERLKNPKIEE